MNFIVHEHILEVAACRGIKYCYNNMFMLIANQDWWLLCKTAWINIQDAAYAGCLANNNAHEEANDRC